MRASRQTSLGQVKGEWSGEEADGPSSTLFRSEAEVPRGGIPGAESSEAESSGTCWRCHASRPSSTTLRSQQRPIPGRFVYS
jgi:hypothetical protein